MGVCVFESLSVFLSVFVAVCEFLGQLSVSVSLSLCVCVCLRESI